MKGRLEGKVAIVTGGGRGIGRSVAMLMAKEGASVVVADLGSDVSGTGFSHSPADDVANAINNGGGQAVACYDSVSDFQTARKITEKALNDFGQIDILCHAAGVLRDRMIFNMTEEEWDKVLSVHLYGAYNMVRHCVTPMMNKGYGRIALLSSISGLGSVGQSNYSAAKEGMVGFVHSLSSELEPHGISINAVYPSADTRMTSTIPEATKQKLRAREEATKEEEVTNLHHQPSRESDEARLPENNAPKIVYLCTESGGLTTGQVIGSGRWSFILYSQRQSTKRIHKKGYWTLDELDKLMPVSLASGLYNPSPAEPSS